MIVRVLGAFLLRILKFCKCVFLLKKKGLDVDVGVIIHGRPVIKISRGAQIVIGANVTLNSSNDGYHANMHSPVKLMADREGAVIKIGSNTRINGACLHAFRLIEVGNNCLIAANVQIIDANGHDVCPVNRVNSVDAGRPIVIEDDVWIGLNSIVLPGVKIGRGSVIGANSVVSRNVPPMVVFSGNPGRVVRDLSPMAEHIA